MRGLCEAKNKWPPLSDNLDATLLHGLAPFSRNVFDAKIMKLKDPQNIKI